MGFLSRPWSSTCDPISPPDYTHLMEPLPGGDLIEAGLGDLQRGVDSVPALLVSIGAPRLRRLGFRIDGPLPTPEFRLYELLRQRDPDAAHGRYNALIRRLVSFERAASCASQ